MPGPRQPTELLKAAGRKHLSRAEEAERRRREAHVEPAKTAKPPKWLPEELKKDFRALGRRLIAAGLYTDLDGDTLGRYLSAQRQYLLASETAERALRAHDQKDAEAWSRIQDRYFKQARSCANDLGLTVSSRCRLVLPESDKSKREEDNPFLQLLQGGGERYA